eukprot:PLAT14682.1.p2 GENE.PLAT14682.1~~PLAT14682.1.p2  ORF type:complete len:234 (+),score=91.04 PLAT14682.1:43-744(+)
MGAVPSCLASETEEDDIAPAGAAAAGKKPVYEDEEEEAAKAAAKAEEDAKRLAKLIAARDGGLSAIVAAMKSSEDDEEVQAELVTAISRLAKNGHKCEGARRMGTMGAIAALVRAVELFPESVRLAEAACDAVSQLAKFEASSRDLLSQGGVRTVVSCMRAHGEERDIQWWGANAIYFLSRLGPVTMEDNVAALRDEGAVDVLGTALERFSDDAVLRVQLLEAAHALGVEEAG